ncbi:hypothetical protein OHT76_02810 [Streptomyces sp. NBC_00287]|uniref:hypothetical protein n=1 Tax=Streptomyces sp. NBC_00287 TaxID=2975702 RepID=UPI002E2E4A49|nr:hypothetical protein [Streptomyces sp. NBC_00287]
MFDISNTVRCVDGTIISAKYGVNAADIFFVVGRRNRMPPDRELRGQALSERHCRWTNGEDGAFTA